MFFDFFKHYTRTIPGETVGGVEAKSERRAETRSDQG